MRVSRATVRQLTSLEVAHSAADLVDLQRVAYKREAELIGDDRIPQLSESAADLVAAGLVWLVVENQGRFVAALGFEESSQEIGIDRLVVHPDSHRQGLGAALVAALPMGFITVSTGRDNLPARRLYESLSFCHVDDEEVLPGLWVSHYKRD